MFTHVRNVCNVRNYACAWPEVFKTLMEICPFEEKPWAWGTLTYKSDGVAYRPIKSRGYWSQSVTIYLQKMESLGDRYKGWKRVAFDVQPNRKGGLLTAGAWHISPNGSAPKKNTPKKTVCCLYPILPAPWTRRLCVTKHFLQYFASFEINSIITKKVFIQT